MGKTALMLIASLMLLFPEARASVQDYVRNGNEYSAARKSSESTDVKTTFVWKDSKGNVYDIYITKNNACYVNRVSSKTGKPYRQYLSKEIAADIAKSMNRKQKEDK